MQLLDQVPAWGGKILATVGAAAVIGSGATIWSNKVDIARLQEGFKAMEALTVEMKETREAVTDLNRNVSILNDRMSRGELDERHPAD